MDHGQAGTSSGGAEAFADPELEPPFDLIEPVGPISNVILSSPHSGSVYPRRFLACARLDSATLRRSEDAFVDELFAGGVEHGAPLIRARFPRAFLDVNREPYELDPRMFEGRLPSYANTRSMRVAGGLGTIARIVADGHDIYRGRLPVDDALLRIERLYKPYHRTLRSLLARIATRFGYVVLVDCHSMPSTSVGRDEATKADIVLGDRFGTSCAGILADLVDAALRARGYRVVRNKPYAGGFITEHYGNPLLGRHAIQVEINRALYMDERTLVPLDRFGLIARDLSAAFGDVMREIGSDLEAARVAAE